MHRSIFFIALSGISLLTSAASAQDILLDEVMTKEEQKKTGVYNMTMQQKVELEAWINRTFILKPAATSQVSGLSLSININNGQKIQLSDGSLWEVAPRDVPTAAAWLTPFPINILPSNDPNYPTMLVDVQTGASVKARQVTSAATAPSQPSTPPTAPAAPQTPAAKGS